MLRKEKLEFESQSHSDLCSALAKQADQWQDRLTTARKQAEEQRKLIIDRYSVTLVKYPYVSISSTNGYAGNSPKTNINLPGTYEKLPC